MEEVQGAQKDTRVSRLVRAVKKRTRWLYDVCKAVVAATRSWFGSL